MLLTVGELARRCGLTVRALHHYDAIGLLIPSVRSAAGYRHYDRANIERLHRIQALRQLGLSLADIGTALSGPELPLVDVIDRQVAQIDREGKYPPAKPGALVCEPLEAAGGVANAAPWVEPPFGGHDLSQ